MKYPISRITIKGFKSIRNLSDFELRNLNVLIGPNGSGKSNFIGFFSLIRSIARKRFQYFVENEGGADKLLYLGSKFTQELTGVIQTAWHGMSWNFNLFASKTDNLLFYDELIKGSSSSLSSKFSKELEHGFGESILFAKSSDIEEDEFREKIIKVVIPIIESWITYHFHDTGAYSAIKKSCTTRDDEYLRSDASNLAAFLLFLKNSHNKEYQKICETIQLAAPFFEDFRLRERKKKDDKEVLLEWHQKGSDYPFHPSQISDGTLRFICLATALLQPEPPSTILLDEPELGLHPHALALLAGLIQKASQKTQVIVSTQSATLIDHFEPEDIIITERENGESKFRRLDKEGLKVWLEDYSLGELWQKNIFEDSPKNE